MSRDYQGEFQRMQEKIRSQGAGGMYGNGDLEAIVNDSIADARIHRELVAQDHLQRRELAVEDVQLIKDVIAKGASDGELRLFVQICNRTGLDPFLHQIWLIPRRSKVGTDSHGKDIWQTSMQPQVSIDGLRLLAQRTGRYAGQIGPLWCGEDGEWKDVWFGEAPPAAAKVGVRSKSFTEPLWAVARWDSYHLDTKFWRDSPDNQLAICAERIALRKAFPAELAGFSVRDVDSDDDTVEGVWTEQETPTDDHAAPAGPTPSAASPPTAAPASTPGGGPHPTTVADEVAARAAERIIPGEKANDPGAADEPTMTAAEFRATLDGKTAGLFPPPTTTATSAATPPPVPATGAQAATSGGAAAPADPDNVRKYVEAMKEADALHVDIGGGDYDINEATVTKGELKEKALRLRAAIDAAYAAEHAAAGAP